MKSYFENTPAEVLERDRKEVEYLNEIGPDALEYAEYVKEYFGIELSCTELNEEETLKYDIDKKMSGYSGNPQYYFAA